jgi:hypothetical protein
MTASAALEYTGASKSGASDPGMSFDAGLYSSPSASFLRPTGSSGNEPFGSRPEAGTYLIAFTLLSPPGEVPEGRAGVRVQAESTCA